MLLQNAGCQPHSAVYLGSLPPHISAPPLQIGGFAGGYVGVRTGLTAPRALQDWLRANVACWRSRKTPA